MKRLIIIKIISTLLLTAFVSLVFHFTRPQTYRPLIKHEAFWVKKAFDQKKYDYIVYGDSRVYRGVNPDSLSFEKINAINLGFSSGGINKEMLDFVKNHIDFNSTNPKVILLGITPNSLITKSRKNNQYQIERERNKYQNKLRIFKGKYLSVFEPFNINDRIVFKGNGYYHDYLENGFVESRKEKIDSTEALSSYFKELTNSNIDSLSVSEILTFVEEMNEKNINVFGYRPPTTKAMELLEDSLTGFNELKLKTAFEQKGGHWIDIQNKYSYLSYDGSHLDKSSALRFTKYLRNYLYRFFTYEKSNKVNE